MKKQLLVLALLLIPVAGCDERIETRRLVPTLTETRAFTKTDYALYSCYPWVCYDLNDHDYSCYALPRDEGEVTVGFDYKYEPGTDPCACWWLRDCVFRGGARFDLGTLSGKDIITATLKWTDRGSCVERLFVSGSYWNVFSLATSVEIVSPWPANSSGAGQLDVSHTVRDWVLGTFPNHGFLFVGPDESFANWTWENGSAEIGSGLEGTHACRSNVGPFELVVEYTD